jgi:gliding motility-associated lipoprotein GldH
MNKNTLIFIGLVIAFAGLTTSCDQDVAYAESKSVDKSGWLAGDTLTLSPSIIDADANYDVYLWVRHSKEYDYRNIWLKVISEPMLTNDSTFMLDIPVADKTGRWLGHCSQSLCTVRVLLQKNYRFQEASAFRVDVLQYMREETLQDVRDVGIEIVQAVE